MCSGPDFTARNETRQRAQSVHYSCFVPFALQATNKQLRCESRLAWSRKHFARLVVPIRASIEDTTNSSLPTRCISPFTRAIQVSIHISPAAHIQESRASKYQRKNLSLLLIRSLGDLLYLNRFLCIELQIVLSDWMHVTDIMSTLEGLITSTPDTIWDPVQVVPLDRWLSKSRVWARFVHVVDNSSVVSGTVTVLAPWRSHSTIEGYTAN
jgi:hypothetical protein